MSHIHSPGRFVVRQGALEIYQGAICEFLEYVRTNEPDTSLYTSLQSKEYSNRFLHYFIFKDEAARHLHSNSDMVKRFTRIFYLNLVAPVEVTEYNVLANTK